MNNQPHFLAIIKDDKVKQKHMEQLKSVNATCDIIDKLEDLSKIPKYIKYHGLLIDLHSLFKLPRLDRAFLKLHAYNLPVLKFIWDFKKDAMVITHTTMENSQGNELVDYVKKCSLQPGKEIRRERRYNKTLNAKLDNDPVNISNISSLGCFVLTTMNRFHLGDEVLLSIEEFTDKSPVSCIIHRIIEWGNEDVAAGIGVEFLSMTKDQRVELDTMLMACIVKMENELDNDTY